MASTANARPQPFASHAGASTDNVSLCGSTGGHAPALGPNFDLETLQRNIAESIFAKAERQHLVGHGYRHDAVVLRVSRESYVAYPPSARDGVAMQSIRRLRCEAAVTISSGVVQDALATIRPGQSELILTEQQRVQVVDSLQSLWSCRKAQGAAFIKAEGILIVWTEDGSQLLDSASQFQSHVLQYFESVRLGTYKRRGLPDGFAEPLPGNAPKYSHHQRSPLSEKPKRAGSKGHSSSAAAADEDNEDDDGGESASLVKSSQRPVRYLAPFLTGMSLGLNLLLNGLLVRQALIVSINSGNYLYLVSLVAVPFSMALTQFFTDNIFGTIAQIVVPYGNLKTNSLYYSGVKPEPLPLDVELPSMTVQMPVYKEALDSVIAPTILNLKRAIRTYELQGGKANLVVCDDGMQLIDEDEQQARRDFYEIHGCGWVARPGHKKNGFLRPGRFKKASNLNFFNDFSYHVSDQLQSGEAETYDAAFQAALDARNGIAWAAGDVRLGEYLLIIDSDTRVPEDCFLDAASELERSPEVAILQHCSGTMLIADHFFENMMGFFTDVINWSISWFVSSGATAPFVGHNAYLRSSALREVSYRDPQTGQLITWSENTVSEDFDISLRLQLRGYVIRWATYSNLGYLEGVSLTPSDELNRWQKYAFGCSELILNPFRLWPKRGPITTLFWTFLTSDCAMSQKVNVASYMLSFYALAVSCPFTIGMFLVIGLLGDEVRGWLVDSFQIWLSLLVVFQVGGTTARLLCHVRSQRSDLRTEFVRQVKYILPLVVFFSGLSYHILLAVVAHPFEYNMTWSATVKESEESNFWEEIPEILARYWHCYLLMGAFLALMLVLGTGVLPQEWCIYGINLYWPGAMTIFGHVFYPILLSPGLMKLAF
ncbi:uncharacterized protein PFL1_02199 [Pseudozyma flocculosa PF-1]|uniref:Uncharacterized protein n=1 Tax=Pseudozyma flocculosa TaxID=84751 RepID=A0A5C3FBC6_9BASI|nr:uncharacterized protein PFL1_02199 [Pseudozyma flocculosa PF-1]EPQ30082.1 hypothetical protein PFL1_02199 [Pseudozyma flocculosa PF-1]SPO41426.1 uncharacterized protein PSFLO_06908 [Pseudozyma flocculosa]